MSRDSARKDRALHGFSPLPQFSKTSPFASPRVIVAFFDPDRQNMSPYELLRARLASEPQRWLITGVAGFIGSHLLETLLTLNQDVVGLDNLSTGSKRNLKEVRSRVQPAQWERFRFQEGSVTNPDACREASDGVDYILHQAGFVSVPRSIEDPEACHETNARGTLNILLAAHAGGVRRVVYASSSAVYGDDPRVPKIESQIGRPLSPYGASKLEAEHHAQEQFEKRGMDSVGLRYFNIFGPRQDPTGGYAAVIPQWIGRLLRGEQCVINGDGSITRDYCPVEDAIQANLLAAVGKLNSSSPRIFNVALGSSTTLDALYTLISGAMARLGTARPQPLYYGPPRIGDSPHSSADITAIRQILGFSPSASPISGLDATIRWYATDHHAVNY
jgi:UDP-N-acetylglucosamine 4-epimerase